MKKIVKRSLALVFVVALVASMLVIPAEAANNEIGQVSYWGDGGEGNPHCMAIYTTYSLYFQFRGDDIKYISWFANSSYGSAECNFYHVTWKPYDAEDNICDGWLNIMPTDYGIFPVYICLHDHNGVITSTAKFYLDVKPYYN